MPIAHLPHEIQILSAALQLPQVSLAAGAAVAVAQLSVAAGAKANRQKAIGDKAKLEIYNEPPKHISLYVYVYIIDPLLVAYRLLLLNMVFIIICIIAAIIYI